MARRNLTKDKICQMAIELILADGLDKLSMRSLAEKLNIKAASLYNHITNKAELLDSLQDTLYAQFNLEIKGSTWQEILYNLATDSRKGLLAIPSMIVLFATRPLVGKEFLNHAERVLHILVDAGFQYDEVLTIYRNLYVFILGHVLAEVGIVPGEKDASNESSLKNVNLDGYPVLQMAYSNPINFEQGFKIGLEAMLNGLNAKLCREPSKI